MTTAEMISIGAATVALLGVAAAWGAIIANRRNTANTIRAQINIAARNSRATVVSANRQKWIDAIREDMANFISVRSQIAALKFAGSFQGAGRDALLSEERELRAKLVMLQARIEMRLNHGEDDHLALLDALRRYDQEASEEKCPCAQPVAKFSKPSGRGLKRKRAGSIHTQERLSHLTDKETHAAEV